MGVAADEDDEWSAFEVFVVEGFEVVDGEAADALGGFEACVVVFAAFESRGYELGKVAEADVAAVAGNYLVVDGGSEFVGTIGELHQDVAHGLDAFGGFVALGAEVAGGVGGVAAEEVVDEASAGAVAEGSELAYLLEHHAVHPPAEVFGKEDAGGYVGGVEGGGGEEEPHVALEESFVGAVVDVRFLRVGALEGARGLVDDAVAVVDEAVAGEEVGEGGGVGVAGEVGLAVAGEDLPRFVVQLFAGVAFPLLDAGAAEVGRLLAVDDIVGEGVEPFAAAVLGRFLVGSEVVGDDVDLLGVVAGIGEPALAECHDGFEVRLKAGEGEEALVVGGGEEDAAAEAVELEVELGEVEAVATY